MFTNVRLNPDATATSPFRLVTNLFGTARRAELAFGERPLRLIRRVVELAETLLPPTPGKLWSARDVGKELLRVGTRNVQTGPVGDRAAARERAGADARLAHRGRATAAGAGLRTASVDGERGVRADGRGAAAGAKAGGALRRSLRLLLAAARLPGIRGAPACASKRRNLSGDRRRQAPAGRLLHRRSAAGAAVAAVSAGDAGRRASLVVRRDRLSLAGGGGRQA